MECPGPQAETNKQIQRHLQPGPTGPRSLQSQMCIILDNTTSSAIASKPTARALSHLGIGRKLSADVDDFEQPLVLLDLRLFPLHTCRSAYIVSNHTCGMASDNPGQGRARHLSSASQLLLGYHIM